MSIAERAATESFTTTPCEAVYTAKTGEQSRGRVSVTVSTASISARFEDISAFAIPEERYGEPGGKLEAADGSWRSSAVTFTGTSAGGARLFNCPELHRSFGAPGAAVASTRVILAGAGWSGASRFAGRAVVFQRLAPDATSHHDERLAVALEGALSAQELERLELVVSLCAGILAPVVTVERYAAGDELIAATYVRSYRRVGRFPHSPFPDDDGVRLRAVATISEAMGPLAETGYPAEIVFDQIIGSNVAAQIHLSATLLMQAVQTTAFHFASQRGAPAGGYRDAFAALVEQLRLDVDAAGLDRLTSLRHELLDHGYFGAPGYETGRPQKDIKFIRDIAHTAVFRLCGYTGPFWSSERFRVETFG